MLLKSMLTLIGSFLYTIGFTQTISPGPVAFCPGDSVKITATGGISYQWKLNGNNISGAIQAVFNAKFVGNYTVIVSRANSSDTTLGPVVVTQNENPVVDFTIGSNNVCSGTPLQFTSNISGGKAPYSYSWLFGDLATSTNANPSHALKVIGCGNETFVNDLLVKDANGCSTTKTKSVTILKAPDVKLKDVNPFSPFSNCSNNPTASTPQYTLTVDNFSDISCVNSYTINWGDGSTLSGLTNASFPLTHTYNKLGAFDLVFTGTGSNGCSNSQTYKIANQSFPDIGIGKFGSSSGCDTVGVFIALSYWQKNSDGTTYLLTFGDGSTKSFIHPINPKYTDDTTFHEYVKSPCPAPSFPLSITATNACKSETFYGGTIVVNIRPKASFTPEAKSTCIGKKFCFINTTVKGSYNDCSGQTIYSWDFGDPASGSLNISALENPCHIFNSPGVYTVTLTSANPCGTTVDKHDVCVMAPPKALFKFDTSTGCAPFKPILTNLSHTDTCDATSFQWSVVYKAANCGNVSSWSFAAGSNETSVSPSFIFNNPGEYNITLTIKSPCQDVTYAEVVSVKGKPNVSLSGDTATCGLFNYNPRALPAICETGSVNYNWTFQGGTPTASIDASPGQINFAGTGDHAISLKASNSCGDVLLTQNFVINPAPIVSQQPDTSVCAGNTLGPLKLSSTNNATISWTNNNTSIGLKSSGTGNISSFTATNNTGTPKTATITVTARLGSCTTTDVFTITVNPTPQPPAVTGALSYCKGDVAPALSTTTNGTILWYDNATGGSGSTIPPFPATNIMGTINYYLSSVNSSGCESSRSTIAVTTKPVPSIVDSSFANPLTCGAATGSIILKGLLANTSYIVYYTKAGAGATTKSIVSINTGTLIITGLIEGTYSNIYVDLNGCLSNVAGPFILSDPTTPEPPTVSSNGPMCSTQELRLNASTLLTGTVTYQWSGPNGFVSGGASPILSNASTLASGDYLVTIKQNNCTSLPASLKVIVNATPVLSATTNNGPLCDTSTIELKTTSTPSAATYVWLGPASFSSNNQNPSIPKATTTNEGSYTVTATSIIGGCVSLPASTLVTIKPVPVITSATQTNPGACGTATGSISLAGLTVNTSFNVSYLKDGTPVNQTITASASGSLNIANLSAGTYSNIQVQLNGCPSNTKGPFTLSDPNPPAAPIASANGPLCSGNTLNLTATSSETGTKNFAWQGPNNYTSLTQNPSLPNATTTASGTYRVTVTINNCKSLAGIIEVLVNPTPAIPVITASSPVCSGNTISLSTKTNADHLYAWTGPNAFTASTPDPSITNAAAINSGTYHLVVTTISGNCPSPLANAQVTVNPTPAISAATQTNPTACGTATGSIILEGLTANTTYEVTYLKDGMPATRAISALANGTLTIASLSAGTYSNIQVQLTGCPSNIKGPFTLSDPNPPAAPVTNANGTLCSGNTLNLTATSSENGTKAYTWQGPNNFTSTTQNPTIPSATVGASGTYSVTVTINNCKSVAGTIDVLVNPTPGIPVITASSPVCSGNTITLRTPPDADYVYAWSGPGGFNALVAEPSINNAASINAGNYQLLVTTISGNCPSPMASVPVVVNPTPAITTGITTNPNACGTATGSIELNGLSSGSTYTITYNSPAGTATTVNLVANSTGTIRINNLFGGAYTNIVATLNACPSNSIASVMLTDPNPPAAPIASGFSPLCTGDTIRLSATSVVPNVTYQWSGPDNFNSTRAAPMRFPAAANQSGKYFVTVTINNCVSLPDSVEIVVNLHPETPVASSNSPVCREGTLQLNATTSTAGVVSYSWTGPNNFTSNDQQPMISNVTVAEAGTYSVIAKQLNCFSLSRGATTVVIKPKPVIANAVVNNPTSCGTYTGSIELSGLLPNKVYTLSYQWNNGTPAVVPATSNPAGVVVIRDLPAGVYNDISVADNGCPSNPVGPFELINVPSTLPTIGSNGPVCAGSTLRLTSALAVSGTVTYEWLGPNGFTSRAQNPVIDNIKTEADGTYTITTILNGCRSSNSIEVVVSPASDGGITAMDSTVCIGTNNGLITVSGYTGSIVRWQASTNNGNTWANLSNTNATLVYNDLTVSTWYRAAVQSGVCSIDNSSVTRINVVSKVDNAVAGADQLLCNQVSVNLKANNPSVGRGAWSQIAGSTAIITAASNAVTAVTGLQPNQSYTFRWTITGATGCGSSADDITIVNRPAITTASAGSDVNICDFTNTRNITLSGNTYRSFEKGRWIILSQPQPASALISNANINNPVFTFSKPGVYRLVWSITNDVNADCEASTDTITIRASNPPVAGFTINTIQLCTGNPVTVVNTSQNANGYQWLWGDGDTTTFTSGTHSYQSTAQYTIRLVATNTAGTAVCTDTSFKTINAYQKIRAQIQVAPGNACVPYNLQLTALNTEGASAVQWLIYDHGVSPALTTATGTTVAHTYNFATSDSVKLIVNNTVGCADTAVYRFKVYPVPVTTIQPLQLKTCSHDTVVNYTSTTTNTGGEAINYRWYINGSLRGNTNPFAFRFITSNAASNATVYNIKLLAQNAGYCGDTTLPSQLTVLPLPAAGIKVLPLLIQQQPDYTFTFEDSTAAAPPKFYLWSMGDRSQQTRSTQKIEYTYGDTGIYKVRLNVTDATNGCTNNDSVQVQVQYIPGYLQVPDAICPGCSNNAVRQFLPLGKGLSYYRLRIYTTWGQLLFETTALNADGSPKEAWTAKVDALAVSKQLQQDVYRWEIEARYINNTEWRGMLYPNSSKRVKSGFITVIK